MPFQCLEIPNAFALHSRTNSDASHSLQNRVGSTFYLSSFPHTLTPGSRLNPSISTSFLPLDLCTCHKTVWASLAPTHSYCSAL